MEFEREDFLDLLKPLGDVELSELLNTNWKQYDYWMGKVEQTNGKFAQIFKETETILKQQREEKEKQEEAEKQKDEEMK